MTGKPETSSGGKDGQQEKSRRREWWMLFLLAAAFAHLFIMTVLQLSGLGQTVPGPEPIPVEMKYAPEPPPKEELPEELASPLNFRKPLITVEEKVKVIRPQTAFAPPPPDVVLDMEASSGGLAMTLSVPSAIGGIVASGAGGGRVGEGLGPGNAMAAGAGTFAEYIGELREIGLDVVFVMDATGTMQWVIDDVKLRIRDIADVIRTLVPLTRFGVVAYRDRDKESRFVTRVQPLTLNISRVRRFLDNVPAFGGYDWPEAVDEGLRVAVQDSGWREPAKKVIILVGDAPPHDENLGAALSVVRSFRARNGTVTAVDVSADANLEIIAQRTGRPISELTAFNPRGVMREFAQIASAGGGDASTLKGETRVARRLAVLIFGERFAAETRLLLEDF